MPATRCAAAVFVLLIASCPVRGETIGDWTVEVSHGTESYQLSEGSGNLFTINCSVAADWSGASIDISIGGRAPEDFSIVRAKTKDGEFGISIGENGVGETDSRVSSTNFKELWSSLRRSNRLTITYEDGRSVTFRSRGGKDALGDSGCDTTFDVEG